MRVVRFDDAGAFAERAFPYLLAREAEHNLLIALAERLRGDPRSYGDAPYLAVAEDEGEVVGATLRTPPWNPVLSEFADPDAIGLVAAGLREAYGTLPGAIGPKAVVAGFVDAWSSATGATPRRDRADRIYEAEAVTPPAGVPGRMRDFAERDRELVLEWLQAFVAEALPGGTHESTERILQRRLEESGGRVVIWEDGVPVSVAACGGPTPNGIRIGPVYTPPEHRRRGYASAVTAALTQALLDGGRRFVFLFTDLSNPTSNSIYQAIGYRAVADVDHWAFE